MPRQGVLVRRGRVPQPGRRGAGRRRATSPTRTIRRTFAPAPLDDVLGSARVDWRPSGADTLDACATPASAPTTPARARLDRAIGSASQRQRSRNRYQSVVGTWTRTWSARRCVNVDVGLVQHASDNADRSRSRPARSYVPEHAGRLVVPRAAGHRRRSASSWPTRVTLVRGAHTLRVGGEWQRVDARLRPRRVPAGPHRVRRGLRRLRSQRRRPRRRWRPAVRGDAAQRQARSGAGDPRRRQRLRRGVRPGRLARCGRT